VRRDGKGEKISYPTNCLVTAEGGPTSGGCLVAKLRSRYRGENSWVPYRICTRQGGYVYWGKSFRGKVENDWQEGVDQSARIKSGKEGVT